MDVALAVLDRITPLDVPPGGRVTVRGAAMTSIDGSVFDAAMQWDGLAAGATRGPGLFDLAAGGLRVVEEHPERHAYALAAAGPPSPACAAVGASTCLVPRLDALGYERLHTAGELGQTLSGNVVVEGPVPASLGRVAADVGIRAAAFVVGALAVAALGAIVLALLRRSRSPFRRTRSAAKAALAATQGDPSLAPLHAQIRDLVERAQHLETTRRDLARSLRRVDRAGIDARIAACMGSRRDGAGVLPWLLRERDEAERIEREHASCLAGLERIESALRVVALQAAARREASSEPRRSDPVDAVALELELRAAAMAEADRAVA
jgi:hypothetical protein